MKPTIEAFKMGPKMHEPSFLLLFEAIGLRLAPEKRAVFAISLTLSEADIHTVDEYR